MTDKMPPPPDSEWFVWCQNAYEGPYYSTTPGYTADEMHAYARAYAAERVAPMVEALQAIVDRDMTFFDGCVDRNMISYGEIQQARAALAAEQERSNG